MPEDSKLSAADRALGEFFQQRTMARALEQERNPRSIWNQFKQKFTDEIRPVLERLAEHDAITRDYLAQFDATDIAEEEDPTDVLEEWQNYVLEKRRSGQQDVETEKMLRELESLAQSTKRQLGEAAHATLTERLRDELPEHGPRSTKQSESVAELDPEIANALQINASMLSESERSQLAALIQQDRQAVLTIFGELGGRYGSQGIRTGLALAAEGIDVAAWIADCRARVGEPLLRAAIAQHSELLEVATVEASEIRRAFFTVDRAPAFDVHTVRNRLLHRAAEYVTHLHERTPEALKKDFQHLRGDLQLFAAVFKDVARQNGEVDFDAWNDLDLESVVINQLDEDAHAALFEQCKEVLIENWKEKGVDAMQEALHGLEDGFAKKEAETRMYFLRHRDDVLAFMRFDDRPDLGPRTRYAGSLNTNPATLRSSIGLAFFHEVLKTEGEDHSIEAHVLARDGIGTVYVEQEGFVLTGVETEWFTIRHDAAAAAQEKLPEARFLIPQEQEQMIAWVREKTNSGKVIQEYRREMSGEQETRILS